MDFYFAYPGNKQKEIKEFINLFNIDVYNNIIEPFGGSLSFSRYIYHNIDINKKLKYYISDLNNDLVFFCNNFYKDKNNIINDTINDINNINNKDDYNKYYNNKLSIDHKDFLKYYLFISKFYQIRKGLYPSNRSKPKFKNYINNTKLTDDFFINNEYKCLDFRIYLEQFKNDERSIIFLDPPYISSDNSFYIDGKNIKNKQCNEFWEYLYNYLHSCKCKFILIVNDNIFMKLLFKKFYKGEYYKRYENTKYNKEDDNYSKNECNHIIFTNINYN